MAASPALDSDAVVELTIKREGKAIDESIRVASVEVHRAANRVPSARIVILGGDTPDEAFAASDSEAFEPGAAITISAGYHGQEAEIFSGIVARHGIEITGDGGVRIIIDCLDSAVAMTAPAAGAAAVLSLTYGADLLEFHAETDARMQRAADGRQPKQGPSALRGRMKFQGSAMAAPGVLVTVAGVGTRFGGDVCVTAVRHEISGGSWITEAAFGAAPDGSAERLDAGTPAAATVAQGAEGPGMKVELDEARKVITITTPAADTIVIGDDGRSILLQDKNSNRVTLNGHGISLESPKDIVLDAKGRVSISAGGNIELAAQADVRAAGLNITLNASAGFTARGTATAELSASGPTTVKGGLVMIN